MGAEAGTDNAKAAARACTSTPSAIETLAAPVTWGLMDGATDVLVGGAPPGLAMMADADCGVKRPKRKNRKPSQWVMKVTRKK